MKLSAHAVQRLSAKVCLLPPELRHTRRDLRQQMPIPPGGATIKRNWIQRYTDLPTQHERFLILQSWDTANKVGPENDFSVCTTWFVTRDRRWYLLDVWRKRVDYPELKAAVRNLAAIHG